MTIFFCFFVFTFSLCSDIVFKMDEKKLLMTKGRKIQMKRNNKNLKIEGGTKYYRWKSERKR